MRRAAIFDLDGTLCNIDHRLHHVRNGARDWDAFFAGIPDDLLNEPIAEVLESLSNRLVDIVLCSGRPERCRDATVEWLDRHGIGYSALYMRPDGDTRPDHVVKAQILEGIKADGYDVFLVVDDRPSVVSMWREHDLTCLQCAPSEDPTQPEKSGLLTLLVGPSGAGKSQWLLSEKAKELGIDASHVISSDRIRADLCGDFKEQAENDRVFRALHAVVKTRIKHGLPCVVDATNIRRRDRMECVGLTKGQVRYIVLNRSMQDKRRDGNWRNGIERNGKLFDLIGHHEQTFKSQLKEILAGDNQPNVEVIDMRGAR